MGTNQKLKLYYFKKLMVERTDENHPLKRTDIESDDLKLVARALLPAEICEGTQLKYEFMTYSII